MKPYLRNHIDPDLYDVAAEQKRQWIKRVRNALGALQSRLGFRPKSFCLITGPPRSGTTALRRWLGEQPGVVALHETRILVGLHYYLSSMLRFEQTREEGYFLFPRLRRFVYDYHAFRAGSSPVWGKVLIDKEPLEPVAFPDTDYASFIPNVKRVFPKARIIFIIRDPVATIWSMSQRKWGRTLTGERHKSFRREEYLENWCACAEIALAISQRDDMYVCQFERLCQHPENETRRIFDFLTIEGRQVFEPHPTKEVGFSGEELERILETTRPYVEALQRAGLIDSSLYHAHQSVQSH